MQEQWVILSIGALGAVAGYLGMRVVKHGEVLARLTAQQEGVTDRFDRQDKVLSRIEQTMQALSLRWGIRPSPYPEQKP